MTDGVLWDYSTCFGGPGKGVGSSTNQPPPRAVLKYLTIHAPNFASPNPCLNPRSM